MRISDWSSDVCSSDLPSKPAVFSGQSVVRDSSGVRFDAVSFHMPYPGTVKETGKAIALYGSSNISLSNVRAYGSLDGTPQNDGLGIDIQGSRSEERRGGTECVRTG